MTEQPLGAEAVARTADRVAIKRAMELASYYNKPFLSWLLRRFYNSV